MISFGTQLQKARTEHGWSIDEVSFLTKVPTGIIQKLENDDYSSFSSPLYVKSYLTKYANQVGLNFEDDLKNLEFVGFDSLDSYFASKTIVGSLEKVEIAKMTQKFRRTEPKQETPIFLVGSVVALICLLATFYYSGSQANIPESGARDTVFQFENKGGSFSRDAQVRSRLVSTKETVRPIETAGLAPVTLSSIKPDIEPAAAEPEVDPASAMTASLLEAAGE